ncbi:Dynein regulatory complex [Salix suchowensis]|nr:Dynein regulatory complex [Salix suchowensis]
MGFSGGDRLTDTPSSRPVVPGPNNTFYIAGGFNGATTQPLSDVWMLNVSGTLSSNLPDSVAASWQRVSITPRYRRKLTKVISPDGCPAPRLSPTVISNTNPFSTRFASQAFLLLGIFNASLWDDGGGLEKGEVAVLDINTAHGLEYCHLATLALLESKLSLGPGGRVCLLLPSSTCWERPQYILRYHCKCQDLVAELILTSPQIYGGRDVEGRYLSEVWLLRAYSGELSSTSERWSGYGNGQLQTGANANGAGVSVSYLSQCAVAISPTQSSTSSSLGPRLRNHHRDHQPRRKMVMLDSSLTTRGLSRFTSSISWFNTSFASDTHLAWTYLPILAVIVAHGVGVAGIATAFTSISATSSIAKRAEPSLTLQTLHGQVGLAFFVGLFGLVPILLALGLLIQFLRRPADSRSEKSKATSIALNEKNDPHSEPISRPQSEQNVSPPSLSRQRVHSWGPSTLWQRSTEGRLSDDSESMSSGGPLELSKFSIARRATGRKPEHRSQSR